MQRDKWFGENEDFDYHKENWRYGNRTNLVQVDATYLRHLEWLAEEVHDIAHDISSNDDDGLAPYGLGGILGECFYELGPRHDGRFSNYPISDGLGRIWVNGAWSDEAAAAK